MQEKSALITGASRGIGYAVAKHMASRGYNLLLLARTEDALLKLKNEILKDYPKSHVEILASDITNVVNVEKSIADFYKNTGSMDFLLNNAGYVKRGTSELNSDDLVKMMDTNFIGAVNIIKSVVKIMREKNSGYILNLSSRSAEIPRAFLGGYAASKAALLAYNESLYKELKETNIKVTALCPGFVDTDMTMDVQEDRARFIKTSDLCHAIDFLLALSPSAVIKKLSLESIVQVGGYA